MGLASKDSIGGDLPPFLDPVNHAADLALIFEPKNWRAGTSKYKDPKTDLPKVTQNVNTLVTSFRSQSHLDKGEPFEVKLYTINATVLARDLVELLDKAKAEGDSAPALIAVLKKVPTSKGNDTWVFRVPRDVDYNKVVAYYEKREAAMQAALDSVPDF